MGLILRIYRKERKGVVDHSSEDLIISKSESFTSSVDWLSLAYILSLLCEVMSYADIFKLCWDPSLIFVLQWSSSVLSSFYNIITDLLCKHTWETECGLANTSVNTSYLARKCGVSNISWVYGVTDS